MNKILVKQNSLAAELNQHYQKEILASQGSFFDRRFRLNVEHNNKPWHRNKNLHTLTGSSRTIASSRAIPVIYYYENIIATQKAPKVTAKLGLITDACVVGYDPAPPQ